MDFVKAPRRYIILRYIAVLMPSLFFFAWLYTFIPLPLWVILFVFASAIITDRHALFQLVLNSALDTDNVPRQILPPSHPIPSICTLVHDHLLSLDFQRVGDVEHAVPYIKKPHITFWYWSEENQTYATLTPSKDYDTFATVSFRTFTHDNRLIETAFPAGYTYRAPDAWVSRNSYSLDTTLNEHMYHVSQPEQPTAIHVPDDSEFSETSLKQASLSDVVDSYYVQFRHRITRSYRHRLARVLVCRKLFVLSGWSALFILFVAPLMDETHQPIEAFILALHMVIFSLLLWRSTKVDDLHPEPTSGKAKSLKNKNN